MTYKLALELKNAGFPFKFAGFDATKGVDSISITGEKYYLPTLSELIEACGEGFVSLNKSKNLFCWFCGENPIGADGLYTKPVYSTPEEAVAKLWLKLNKTNEYSNCCNKPVTTGGDKEEGQTNYYVCTACDKPCDLLKQTPKE